MPIRILDVAQQQIQAAKQRHGIKVGIGKRLQPVAGLLEELRLAPREPRCGERQNREETGISCAPLKPAAEKIDLLLNCLLYTSPNPRDAHESRMPSSA